MADNGTDCRENGAVKKAPGDVVNDLYDSCRLLMHPLSANRTLNAEIYLIKAAFGCRIANRAKTTPSATSAAPCRGLSASDS
jgi:hypothetical protein